MEEDLLHGAVERLLEREARRGETWESRAHCRNSILRTAKNLAIDHFRREACRTKIYVHEAELRRGSACSEDGLEYGLSYEGIAVETGGDGDPEARCLREEDRALLLGLLDKVSEDEKKLLVLRELMDLSWGEISRETGIGVDALRVRYSRLKARLRGALCGEGAR